MAITVNRNILVSSFNGNKIFKVSRMGTYFSTFSISLSSFSLSFTPNVILDSGDYEVVTLAGGGKEGIRDERPEECGFHNPVGIAVVESSHTCFVTEFGSNTIRKISFL